MKVICTNCEQEMDVVMPAKVRVSNGGGGVLAGIKLEDMTIEQLRIEKRNAKSVLYKSEKAGATEEMLAPKRIRVEAVEARLAEVAPVKVVAVEAVEVVEAVEAVEAEETTEV